MNRDRSGRLPRAALPLALAATAATAQTSQTNPAPAALPVPAAPVITLPPPSPTPTPSAAPRRAAPADAPRRRATPTPAVSAGVSATIPVPAATPTPPAVTPTPTPTATPSAAAPAPPRAADPVADELARTPAEAEPVENPNWWFAVALGTALLGGLAYLAWRWRRLRGERLAAAEEARRPQVTVAGQPAAPPPPADAEGGGTAAPAFWTPSRPPVDVVPTAVAPPPEQVGRPRVTVALRPRRAGLNLVSATADVELTVRNEGDAAAEAVAVAVHLLAARAGQDGELGALFAAEQGRPALPPFALAPGAERVCRTTLVLPRAAIEPIPVNDRPMFVPLVAVDVRYARPDGGRGQVAAAYTVGAVRAGGDKLSPFWLDAPPRMRHEVEARPHGLALAS